MEPMKNALINVNLSQSVNIQSDISEVFFLGGGTNVIGIIKLRKGEGITLSKLTPKHL